MVSSKTPLNIFPTKKDLKNISSVRTVNKSNIEQLCLKEELLDDLDELNEDQINLLKDTELLQAISMTENDIENKFKSHNIKEDLENVYITDKIELSKTKNKLWVPKRNINNYLKKSNYIILAIK